jgi:hypothetical protein
VARAGRLAGERAEGGPSGATRGTAAEEGPDPQPRPGHGGHGQCAAVHVVGRQMSERERELTYGPAAKFI